MEASEPHSKSNKKKLKQKHIFISDLIKNNSNNNEKCFDKKDSNRGMTELNNSDIDSGKIYKNLMLQIDSRLNNQVI